MESSVLNRICRDFCYNLTRNPGCEVSSVGSKGIPRLLFGPVRKMINGQREPDFLATPDCCQILQLLNSCNS